MSNVIELDRLAVRLGGRPILKHLTGALSGGCIGLLGPNGAGKTTLIHTLLGFHAPYEGTARINGRDIRSDLRAIRASVGYMPERDAFIPGMSCVQFVRFMAELSGLPSQAALERAHEALFFVGLGEARYRPVDTYSLGMKQLAKLAQALVHGPELLILDEPTNGLDPPTRKRMLDLIRSIRDGGRSRILLSSHLLLDVEQSCDEILILKDGQIAAQYDLEAERKLNHRFIEIEVNGDPAAFAGGVAALGCEYAMTGTRRVKVVLSEGIDVPDLYAVAARTDLQIRRLSRKRDSLEDIFLKAMEFEDGRF